MRPQDYTADQLNSMIGPHERWFVWRPVTVPNFVYKDRFPWWDPRRYTQQTSSPWYERRWLVWVDRHWNGLFWCYDDIPHDPV